MTDGKEEERHFRLREQHKQRHRGEGARMGSCRGARREEKWEMGLYSQSLIFKNKVHFFFLTVNIFFKCKNIPELHIAEITLNKLQLLLRSDIFLGN